jgi:hypothetical protein
MPDSIQFDEFALSGVCWNRILQCKAEDTIKGRPLTLTKWYTVAARHLKGNKKQWKNDPPGMVELAICMEVMVMFNAETDLDITNGKQGIVTDILLSWEEPTIPDKQPVIQLEQLPTFLLVKLDRMRATELKGLKNCVIPVKSMCQTFQIKCKLNKANYWTTVCINSNSP